jgi:hypothetical protein
LLAAGELGPAVSEPGCETREEGEDALSVPAATVARAGADHEVLADVERGEDPPALGH